MVAHVQATLLYQAHVCLRLGFAVVLEASLQRWYYPEPEHACRAHESLFELCTGYSHMPLHSCVQLEEVVFSEPQEGFYKRMMATNPTMQMPPSEIAQFVGVLDESEDVAAIQEARQKVAQISAGLKAQLQEPPS